MLEQILDWYVQYGYWVVFFGSLFEGESFILTAGYLASLGKLNLYWIMVIAFFGTVIADQVSFFIGHHYGKPLIAKKAWLQAQSDRVTRLLREYDVWLILVMRFVYGIRVAGPIIVGASEIISQRKFAFWNLVAAAIWSILSCGTGYFFGEAIGWALKHTEYLALVIVGLFVLIFIAFKLYKQLMKKFQ